MTTITDSQALITPTARLRSQPPHGHFPRAISDVTCGDLKSGYPNIQAPICSGQYNTCTFSGSLQGCCDSTGSCQFYTTCKGGLESVASTSVQWLVCPRSAPYCTKYFFWDASLGTGYDGYSCGVFLFQATAQGAASSKTDQVAISSLPLSNSTQSLSPTASSITHSSIRASLSATSSISPSTTAIPSSEQGSNHIGLKAGLPVGIVVAGLAITSWFMWRRHAQRRRLRFGGDRPIEVQQNWH